MDKVVRNKELFFAIADRIEFDSSSYRQHIWGYPASLDADRAPECGTVACIAGHALNLSGWECISLNHYRNGSIVCDVDGIQRRAAKALGITQSESYVLFDSEWLPIDSDVSVPDALRLIGKGENVSEISVIRRASLLRELLREEAERDPIR